MTVISALLFSLGMLALVSVWSLIEIYLDSKKTEAVDC